jgi:hypothetical protein
MKIIKSITLSLWLFVTLLLFIQCNGPKTNLLKIDLPWAERTNEQKLIGVWCSNTYEPSGRTIATNSLSFKTVLYFYNDGTMQEYFKSNTSLGSGDLMQEGTNVKIVNGKLHYTSSKYGEKVYLISISENNLHIVGMINAGGVGGLFTKCNE